MTFSLYLTVCSTFPSDWKIKKIKLFFISRKKINVYIFIILRNKGSNSQSNKVMTWCHSHPCSIPRVKATRPEDAAAYPNFWHSTPQSSWSLIVLLDSLDSLSSGEIWGVTSQGPDMFTSGKMKNYFPWFQSIKSYGGLRLMVLKRFLQLLIEKV